MLFDLYSNPNGKTPLWTIEQQETNLTFAYLQEINQGKEPSIGLIYMINRTPNVQKRLEKAGLISGKD